MTPRGVTATSCVLVLCAVACIALAHGGGLDSSGCHHNRKTGDYHCHRSGSTQAHQPRPVTATRSEDKAHDSCFAPGTNTEVYVDKVVDGDTLDVRTGGTKARVRLLGIDCPESHANAKCRRQGEDACKAEVPRGLAAAKQTAALVKAKTVVLEDVNGCDRYGRTLAYVRLSDGRDLGESLISEGICADYSAKYPHERSAKYSKLAAWTNLPVIPAMHLEALVSPFVLGEQKREIKARCGSMHGIWQDGSAAVCALPGGRLLALRFDGDALRSIAFQWPKDPRGSVIVPNDVRRVFAEQTSVRAGDWLATLTADGLTVGRAAYLK